MPRKIYDMLGLPPLEKCYFDVPLADVVKKKPLGRINDVLIMVNNNLVPIDFLVMDVECNVSCPIILGRPFLRTAGAIIDMKEGTIKYQFPVKKVMEHFPRRRKKLLFDSILRENYVNLMLHRLILLDLHFLRLAQRRYRKALLGDNPMFYFQYFFFYLSLGSYYYCNDHSLLFLFRVCAKKNL
jgi:hypothetical protein